MDSVSVGKINNIGYTPPIQPMSIWYIHKNSPKEQLRPVPHSAVKKVLILF